MNLEKSKRSSDTTNSQRKSNTNRKGSIDQNCFKWRSEIRNTSKKMGDTQVNFQFLIWWNYGTLTSGTLTLKIFFFLVRNLISKEVVKLILLILKNCASFALLAIHNVVQQHVERKKVQRMLCKLCVFHRNGSFQF